MGTGGIGIIRLSGENCFEVLDKIFIPKNSKKEIKGYTIRYGRIVDDDGTVDEVLVSFFVKPNSFTKEDIKEVLKAFKSLTNLIQ
jgi:tRNA modification GTPase